MNHTHPSSEPEQTSATPPHGAASLAAAGRPNPDGAPIAPSPSTTTGQALPPGTAAPTPSAELDAVAATLRRTDYGNAERLVLRHGTDLRYCEQTGSWLVWDQTRWAANATPAAMRFAKDTARSILREAATLTDDSQRMALSKHATTSERLNSLTAMLRLAETEASIAVNVNELDADPWLLNVANGTLNLRTGHLRDHDRGDLLTRRTAVAYDPLAACPRWQQFLTEVFPDPAVIGYVQKLFGYALTGVVSDQSIILLYGEGSNGKTTLLNVLLQLAGEYGLQAAPDLLLAERRDSHPTAMADLQGRRPVVASEVNEGRRFDEASVKQLTGGDVITARKMRQDYYSFVPSHTLFLAVNHLPEVRGRDHGIWRRIRPIEFPTRFDPEQRDATLPEQLTAELPGILAWAVKGAQRWQDDGHLDPPASITTAVATYKQSTDPLAEFIADCCTDNPAARTSREDLWNAYLNWHHHSGGSDRLTGRAFGLQLGRLGYTKTKSGTVFWNGLKLAGGYAPPPF